MSNFLPTNANLIKLGTFLHLYHNGITNKELAHRLVIFVIILGVLAFLVFSIVGSLIIYVCSAHRLKLRCKQLNLNYAEEKLRVKQDSRDRRFAVYNTSKKRYK